MGCAENQTCELSGVGPGTLAGRRFRHDRQPITLLDELGRRNLLTVRLRSEKLCLLENLGIL